MHLVRVRACKEAVEALGWSVDQGSTDPLRAIPSGVGPLGLILGGYMEVGPCVHVGFLSCGPSNPWGLS